MDESPSSNRSTKEKEFDVLYDVVKQNWTGSLDFIFKHGTFMVLATGAILSVSQGSSVELSREVLIFTGFFFVLLTVLHYFWLNSYRKRALAAIEQLDELGYMDPKRYKGQYVSRWTVNSVQGYHTTLVILLCISLISLWPGSEVQKLGTERITTPAERAEKLTQSAQEVQRRLEAAAVEAEARFRELSQRVESLAKALSSSSQRNLTVSDELRKHIDELARVARTLATDTEKSSTTEISAKIDQIEGSLKTAETQIKEASNTKSESAGR